MAKGPKGEKRKADVIGNAVLVMQIATGQVEEVANKNPQAVTRGAAGGASRALNLSPGERQAIARKAAVARWKASSPKARKAISAAKGKKEHQ